MCGIMCELNATLCRVWCHTLHTNKNLAALQLRGRMLEVLQVHKFAASFEASSVYFAWGAILRRKFCSDNLHLTAKKAHDDLTQVATLTLATCFMSHPLSCTPAPLRTRPHHCTRFFACASAHTEPFPLAPPSLPNPSVYTPVDTQTARVATPGVDGRSDPTVGRRDKHDEREVGEPGAGGQQSCAEG